MPRTYDHNWQRMRLVILERAAHLCQLQLVGCTTKATHVDHIVTVLEGGARLDPDNLRASCPHCNLSRNGTRQAQLVGAFAAQTAASASREW